MENRTRAISTTILFAILDKTKVTDSNPDPPFAGIIGLLNTSVEDQSTEIGWFVVLPAFQGTHVATHAVGLMMTWCLDSPSDGGLGLRRVQYTTHPSNVASARKAEAMGFKYEALLRYERVVAKSDQWHSKMYSICWDDWVEEREKVVAKMQRTK